MAIEFTLTQSQKYSFLINILMGGKSVKINLIIAVTVHFHPEFLKSPVQLNKAKPGIRSQRNRGRWTNCIVQVLQHLHRSKIMSIYLRKGTDT